MFILWFSFLIFELFVFNSVQFTPDLGINPSAKAGAIITQITDLLHRKQATYDLLITICSFSQLVKRFNKRIQVVVFNRLPQAVHKFLVVMKIMDCI